MPMPSQSSDPSAPVVIVGAGLAGLTAALHLAATCPVIVLAKRGLEEGGKARQERKNQWLQG